MPRLQLAPVARVAPILALSVALAGCAGLLDSDAPPASEWWLEPVTPAASVNRGMQSLALDLTVVPGLDTDRILNLGPQARLNHYAGAHWPDHLPEVLGSVLARSFEGAGWRSVTEGVRARSPDDCLLRLETRAFHGRVDADKVTRRVEVRFDGELVCGDDARRISTRQDIPVAENRIASIVAAFQAGLGASVNDLVGDMAP
jgi:ABC-type uncharacterized transport system auxiliary subunit